MCHTRVGAFRRCKDMVDRMGISQQGTIFRESITGNWQWSGVGSMGWSMWRGAYEN